MYGYLHLGRVISFDPASGGYNLQSIGLARTSRWGPVSSAVPGLLVNDRVVLGATGTSRDELVIIAKVGATFPGIADIPGLVAALAGKADDSEITAILATLTSLDGRLDTIEPIVSGHTSTLASHTTTLGTHAGELVSLDGRVDALELKNYPDPVSSVAGRPTTGLFNGKAIYRTDKGFLEFYDLGATKWRVRGVVLVGALADITDPVTDQVAFLGTDRSFYRWDGSAWARLVTGVRTFEAAQSTSFITLTNSFAALTGATVTFTTVGTNSVAMINASIDGESNGATDVAVAVCVVDSTALPGEIHWGSAGRGSYSRPWKTTLATAGSHTIELQALKTGSTNTFFSYGTHTVLSVTVYDA